MNELRVEARGEQYRNIIITAVIAIGVLWAANGAEVRVSSFIEGFGDIANYLSRMVPPDLSILPKLLGPIIETFQIAIIAITIASIVALPISFLAARNTMPNGWIYQPVRTLLNTLRGIPPLLYALIFVSMVGLGQFAGVLALSAHCVGALGRFFAEAIENINPGIVNAAKATGANRIKIIIHAIIPELKAVIIGYILYFFEYNVRTSTVLGLVGAGGIGMQIMISIHLFRYQEVATILITIIIISTVMDRVSTYIREKIIGARVSI